MAIAQEPPRQAHPATGELFTPEASLAPEPQADQLVNLPTLTDVGAPVYYAEFGSPEEPTQQSPEQTKRRRLPAILAAGGVAIGLLAGSLFFKDGADKPAQVTTETTFTPLDEKAPTSTFTIPETNTRTGTVETARIIPGEPTITAQLPGEREIIIPEPRTDGSPRDLYDSVLAAWACYMSSNDRTCRDLLTDGDATRADELTDYYFEEIKPLVEYSDDSHFQVSVFDNPDNPVFFEQEIAPDGTTLYDIAGGNLYFNASDTMLGYIDGEYKYGSDAWQDPQTRRINPSTHEFSRFTINVGQTVEGQNIVLGVYWEEDLINLDTD